MACAARWTLAFAAASGFVAVAMGAVTAHVARPALGDEAARFLDTAVRYEAWHAVALLGLAALMTWRPARGLTAVAIAWAAGSILFSGSLYLIALAGLRFLAPLTPIGGTALLLGWAGLLVWAVAVLGRGRG